MNLPLARAIKLIETAMEAEARKNCYQLWLVQIPLYNKKTYQSFDEFYEKVKPKRVVLDNRGTSKIMEEILNIENEFA